MASFKLKQEVIDQLNLVTSQPDFITDGGTNDAFYASIGFDNKAETEQKVAFEAVLDVEHVEFVANIRKEWFAKDADGQLAVKNNRPVTGGTYTNGTLRGIRASVGDNTAVFSLSASEALKLLSYDGKSTKVELSRVKSKNGNWYNRWALVTLVAPAKPAQKVGALDTANVGQ